MFPKLSSGLGPQFAKYYSEAMPIFKKLLESVSNSNDKAAKVRVLTIDCIGFITASTLTQDDFSQELDQNMELFVSLQQNPQTSGPEHASIINIYCQLASHLREGFSKYMPFIFEKIVAAADIQVGLVNTKREENKAPTEKHSLFGVRKIKEFALMFIGKCQSRWSEA